MTQQEWLAAHPFLDPVARLLDRVDAGLARVGMPVAEVPDFAVYLLDYDTGVPLLLSAEVALDLRPAGVATCAALAALAAGEQDSIATQSRSLAAELGDGAAGAQRVVDFLLGDESFRPASPGLLRFLGWTAARKFLQPVLSGFAQWRNQDRWQRSGCPTCGALPAMAQLIGVDPGRMRFLACGCCGSRWRYRRTACPFCEGDTHRVEVLALDGEGRLRIDHCETCLGYLKTYVGQGREDVMLADWTSLHLDVLAQDRGLQRKAASLYSLSE